ncbi:hypothetical protein [Crenalkalicoccus roseus]|uniref:hypothetical protein n=1 Tax=Crenalkalicoccus roseus TaxID=1485588 RepID=UPI0010804BDF|nr:hypothetical protein [Crenalkalicoccus roseus]
MRSTILRLTLLGTALAMPAAAQISPATPDARPPAAAATESTRPELPPPAPAVTSGANIPHTHPDRTAAGPLPQPPEGRPQDGHVLGGATTPLREAEGGRTAAQMDEGVQRGPLETGANSFTEQQARSRIESAGFTNVGPLTLDGQGIWRGPAMRDGQQVTVGLDFRGNVAALQ